ncbi:hypothetical protein GDO81_000434 [Engystomops pustulosus]|uniref:Uncharacterized protein n=1 Tax=Engystomops pustulosus TaxID=76066 RepID=A0AAV7D5J8_ENGPU|nr:hypothetical protein GDO81_000434 [Engystomops pustulosus]
MYGIRETICRFQDCSVPTERRKEIARNLSKSVVTWLVFITVILTIRTACIRIRKLARAQSVPHLFKKKLNCLPGGSRDREDCSGEAGLCHGR